jgi:alkaline phosphatase D
MSSIRRLATKTLLISSCFVVLFLSGFIGSMVVAKEATPRGSTSIQEAKVAQSPFTSCSQQGWLSGR